MTSLNFFLVAMVIGLILKAYESYEHCENMQTQHNGASFLREIQSLKRD